MSYTFRMTFTGLYAVVPRIAPHEEIPRRADVLLISNPDGSYDGRTKQTPDGHSAELDFSIDNLSTSASATELGVRGRVFLDEEEVTLQLRSIEKSVTRPLNRGLAILEGARKGREVPCRNIEIDEADERDIDYGRQLTDISWVPEIERALPGAGEINPLCLDPVPHYVSARLILEEGELGTRALGKCGNGCVIVQFVPPVPPDNPYRQAMAHKMAVEIDIAEGFEVLLVVTKFKNGDKRIIPFAGSAGSIVEVAVTNLCCGYYASYWNDPVQPEADADFAQLYRLCARHDELKAKYSWMPIPVPVCYDNLRGGETGGINPVKCSGTRFAAAPLDEEDSQ